MGSVMDELVREEAELNGAIELIQKVINEWVNEYGVSIEESGSVQDKFNLICRKARQA